MTTRPFIARWLAPLHLILGGLPAAWLLAFGAVVGRATWQLGHLPRYLGDPDPTSSGGQWLFVAEFVLSLTSLLAFPVWGLLTAVLLVAAPRDLRRNAVSAGLCLLGMAALAWGQQLLPGVFEWVRD